MQRVFTKNVGKFKKGETREYPVGTWKQIARNAGMLLKYFSKEISEILDDIKEESAPKKKPVIRRRKKG
tara:strand:+ start:7751 stop:7957 length:207 start_codon:yes stop_codon:yes gene_type:complete